MILDGHVEVHAAGHAFILHQYAQNGARDRRFRNEAEGTMRTGTQGTLHADDD